MFPKVVETFSPTSLIITALAVLLLVPVMLYPIQLFRWLQRKRYQYEVTFGLYMMTPTEKFILNSFLFLTFSMILIAASLYLPEHVLKITHRAFYYYSGTHPTTSFHTASGTIYTVASSTTRHPIVETLAQGKAAMAESVERVVGAAVAAGEKVVERAARSVGTAE